MKFSEHPLGKILEDSSSAIFVADIETMEFLYVNKAAASELGYTQEEMLSMKTSDISARSKTKEELIALFDNSENTYKEIPECILSTFHKPKRGPAFPVELRIQLSTFNNRPAFVAFVQGINEKHRKLMQLDEMSKNASIGYWDWDLQTGLYDISEHCMKLLGFKPSEIENPIKEWFKRVHPEDVHFGRKAIDKCQKDGLSFVIEFRVKHKEGHFIWVQGSGSVIERGPVTGEARRIYGAILDISERKNADLEKFRIQEKFRALAENSEDLIIQFDHKLRHLYVNPAIQKFRKLKPQEYIGKTHKEIGFPDHLCEFWGKAIKKVFETGESNSEYFETISTKGPIYIDWRIFPEFDQQGNVETVFSVSRDITEFKQVEEEAQKTQKLKSLGVLAGGIAHDFNNILTILFGNISMAKSQLSEEQPSYQSIEKAEQAFQRATHLTGQLLTFAKGGDPVQQDISISQLVQDVASFDLSGSNVKLEFEPPDDLWLAKVDKGQMEQVFSNLTINANQAMAAGGHLYINAENIEIKKGAVPGLKEGRYIYFIVRDEGEGIEPENLNRIFDPYYSTKITGAGLGLATVYSIINKHGGQISVTSTLNSGTSISFYIPASKPSSQCEEISKEEKNIKKEGLARILVMDDEKMIRVLAVNMLKQAGYETDSAEDGRRAIEMYKQSMGKNQTYDCIIMDLTIPGGMGGAKAIQEILKIDPAARAIVASGYAADSVMGRYLDSGFKGVLAKPFSIAELHSEVLRVLTL